MSETRDRQIMVNIEPTFYDALQGAVTKEDMSLSAYVRNLILKDLLDRGLITDRMVTMVVLGKAS